MHWHLVIRSSGDAAEYVLHGLFEGENVSFRMGRKGQPLNHEAKTLYLPTVEAKKRLWEHTDEVTAGLNMIFLKYFAHGSFESTTPFPTCLQAR